MTQLPTGSAPLRTALCQRFSAGFFDDHRKDAFAVSQALIPQPLTFTGFGAPDAHCAADPDLGIYYEVLIWNRRVSVGSVSSLEAKLTGHGFIREGGGTDGRTRSYSAPPGVQDEIGGLAGQLRRIYVTAPSAADPTTSIFWI